MPRPTSQICFAVSVLLFCTSCGRSSSSEPLVASGEHFEVSVGELDQVLRAMPAAPKDAVVGQRNAVLEQLVDQKLLATEAVDRELDRNPIVMQEIEATKRNILATAYVEGLTNDLAKPSDDEIARYYASNPQRYAGRKVATVQILAVADTAAKQPAIAAALKAKNLAALGQALAAAGLPSTPEKHEMRTDMQPMSDNPNFAKLQPADTISFSNQGRNYLVQIDEVRLDPVAMDRTQVEAQMMADKRADIVRKELQRLRTVRKVTFNRKALNAPSMRVDGNAAK